MHRLKGLRSVDWPLLLTPESEIPHDVRFKVISKNKDNLSESTGEVLTPHLQYMTPKTSVLSSQLTSFSLPQSAQFSGDSFMAPSQQARTWISLTPLLMLLR